MVEHRSKRGENVTWKTVSKRKKENRTLDERRQSACDILAVVDVVVAGNSQALCKSVILLLQLRQFLAESDEFVRFLPLVEAFNRLCKRTILSTERFLVRLAETLCEECRKKIGFLRRFRAKERHRADRPVTEVLANG